MKETNELTFDKARKFRNKRRIQKVFTDEKTGKARACDSIPSAEFNFRTKLKARYPI